MKFECIQCGLCCRNIHLIPELKEYHNGDGICMYLNIDTNLCEIYDKRPIICDVEKSYKTFFESFMTEEEYLKKNYEGCELLWEKKRINL